MSGGYGAVARVAYGVHGEGAGGSGSRIGPENMAFRGQENAQRGTGATAAG